MSNGKGTSDTSTSTASCDHPSDANSPEAAKARTVQRVERMKAAMTDGEKKYTTFAAAEVVLPDGTSEIWVSAAGETDGVPSRIADAAGAGEDMEVSVVKNSVEGAAKETRVNDAERAILREAEEAGATVKAIGATRDVCAHCEKAITDAGLLDAVATPAKSGSV
jgi:hypothetical protein